MATPIQSEPVGVTICPVQHEANTSLFFKDNLGNPMFQCQSRSRRPTPSRSLLYSRVQLHHIARYALIQPSKSSVHFLLSRTSSVHGRRSPHHCVLLAAQVSKSLVINGKLFIKIVTLSEQSSQSSFSSFSLSSSASGPSGRSTPWSQNSSFSHGATSPLPYISGQPRIQVASLLTETQSWSYHLEVVQQPLRTAEFGAASLSRLPLAPPVVVQLIVRDRSGNAIIPEMELPFLIAHLSLFSEDGSTPLDMGSAPGGEAPPRRLLYGNLVSSPQRLRDLQGKQGLYFLFPDVSIRWRGRFQLGITLLRLSRTDPSGVVSMAEHGTVLAQARTRAFEVVSHDSYIAPPQTRLTQCFLRQGVRMYTSAVSHLGPQ